MEPKSRTIRDCCSAAACVARKSRMWSMAKASQPHGPSVRYNLRLRTYSHELLVLSGLLATYHLAAQASSTAILYHGDAFS